MAGLSEFCTGLGIPARAPGCNAPPPLLRGAHCGPFATSPPVVGVDGQIPWRALVLAARMFEKNKSRHGSATRQHERGNTYGPAAWQDRTAGPRPPRQAAALMAAGPTRQHAWVALSDRGVLDATAEGDLLHAGLLVIELTLPLDRTGVLLNHQAETPWPRTLALFADPATGLVLMHRQGGSVVRHVLPGPLPDIRGTARLVFQFDAPARHWALTLSSFGAEAPPDRKAQGRNPLPLHLADLQALCLAPRAPGPVLWFGATQGQALPVASGWIGLRTPVATPTGPVEAGSLGPGDLVLTAEHGALPVFKTRHLHLPARGSFAPVLLRAPYFGSDKDLLVSPDQLLVMSGPETEYLFGDEAVLLPAGSLVDGRTALFDQRRAVTGAVMLDLGRTALIEANGQHLALVPDAAPQLPLRALQHYEALTLMTILGRMPRRAA